MLPRKAELQLQAIEEYTAYVDADPAIHPSLFEKGGYEI